MIQSVTVINHHGDKIKLGIMDNPLATGLLITNISGLDAGKVDVNVSEYSITDGGVFTSTRMGTRNIVIDLMYVPTKDTPSVETLRHLSYTYFGVKKPVTLIIQTDERICRIEGYVESNEPDIFSDQESTQISIICPQPFFTSLDMVSTNISGIDSLFEFPFSNESLEERLIEFGTVRDKYDHRIEYTGDYDTGVKIRIIAKDGPVKNVTIYNASNRQTMKIDTDNLSKGYLGKQEELVVTTNVGSKGAYLISQGKTYNAIRCLSINSDWITLSRGDNIITYSAESGIENILLEFDYYILYSGV